MIARVGPHDGRHSRAIPGVGPNSRTRSLSIPFGDRVGMGMKLSHEMFRMARIWPDTYDNRRAVLRSRRHSYKSMALGNTIPDRSAALLHR